MTYATSVSGSGFDTLTSLQECRDSSRAVCVAPTSFNWSAASNGFTTASAWITSLFPSTKYLESLKFGDVDGDGRQDLVWLQDGLSGHPCSTDYIYVAFGELDSNGRQGFTPANQIRTCTPAETGGSKWEVFDYNSDGRSDIMLPGADGNWSIYASQGRPAGGYAFDLSVDLIAGLAPKIAVNPPGEVPHGPPQLSDLNGDGQLDVVYLSGATPNALKARLMLPNGAGWSSEYSINNPDFVQYESCSPASPNCVFIQYILPTTNNRLKYQLLDMDGDSRSDLKLRIGYGFTIDPQCPYCYRMGVDYVYRATDISNNQITIRRYAALSYAATDYRLGDFNGDGLTDKIYRTSGASPTWYATLNTGVSFTPDVAVGAIPNDTPADGLVKVEDVNRDGRSDLLYVVSESSRKVFRVRYAQPNGTFGPESIVSGNNAEACSGGSGCDAKSRSHMFSDLDGDGNLDFFTIKLDDNPDFFLSQSTARGAPRDVITQVVNGLGAKIGINYTPSTNSAVHRRDSGARLLNYGRGSIVSDVLDGGYYLVSSVSSSAPQIGNPDANAATYYRYAGAKLQGGGRGFLGFREITVFDTSRPVGHLATTNSYRQDFPFAGRAYRTIKRAFPSQAFAPSPCLASFPSNACYAQPGQPFPDLGGVAILDNAHAWESDIEISGTTTTPFAAGVQAPANVRTVGSEEIQRDPAGIQTTKSVTAFGYGGYGNITQTIVDTFTGTSTSAMQTVATDSTYNNDIAHWRLGLLGASTVTYQRPGQPNVVRTMGYSHDLAGAATGLLTEERVQPNGTADQALTTAYAVDQYGNRLQAVSCAAPATSCGTVGFTFHPADPKTIKRYSRVEYGSNGRFPVTTYEPFWSETGGEERVSSRILERNIFGDPVNTLDENNVRSFAVNGALGREYFTWAQTSPNATPGNGGANSLTTYRWCTQVACPAGAKFRRQVATQGAPRQWSYFDVLGRPVMKAVETFNAGVNDQDVSAVCTDYDIAGNPKRASNPFFLPGTAGTDGPAGVEGVCAAAARLWTVVSFDILGRPLQVLSPDGSQTSSSYTGLTATVTDPRGNATSQLRNGKGELVTVTDATTMATGYAYTADGNLLRVTRDAGMGVVTNSYVYDVLGRRTQQSDPDTGTTTFQFNALGEPIAQIDSLGQRIDFEIDARGRAWRKTVKQADGTVESQSTFTFDTAQNGNGALTSEAISGNYAGWTGQTSTGLSFTRHMVYDAVGRPVSTSTFVDDGMYGTNIEYDGLGRPWKTRDVSGLWTKTEYNARGAVALCASDGGDLNPACPGGSNTYQRTLQTDAWGNVIKERRGDSAAMEVARSYSAQTGRIASICAGNATCNLTNEAYGWDAAGNLSSHQKEQRYLEGFTYDSLNRLIEAKVLSGVAINQVTLANAYDNLGNICSKNGLGYAYAGASGCAGAAAMSASLASTSTSSRSSSLIPRYQRPTPTAWKVPAAWRERSARQAPETATRRYSNDRPSWEHEADDWGLDDSLSLQSGDRFWVRGKPKPHTAAKPLAFQQASPSPSVTASAAGTGSPHAVSQTGSGTSATFYYYDGRGNQTLRDAPGTASDRTILYSVDDKAHEIAMGAGQRVRFWYGPNGQRYKREEAGKTTLYLDGVEVILQGGMTTFRRYVAGIALQTVNDGVVASTKYLFHDHLGSLVRIANPDGSVAESLDYSPFGDRRSYSDPTATGTPAIATPRGFTGHEYVDGTSVIHMNGRIYDQQLGRFLQADPIIQSPGNAQSWNAYTYVLNNPLAYTDPTGHFAWIAAAAVVTMSTVTVTAAVITVGQIAVAVVAVGAATATITATSASGVSGAYSACPTSNSAGDNSTGSSSQTASGASAGPGELPADGVAWIEPAGNGQGLYMNVAGERVISINIPFVPETAPVAATCSTELGAAGVVNGAEATGLSQLQTALDVAGFLPVIGTAADVVNAGIYAYNGSYGLAAISVIGAVPLVGDAFAAAAKGAKLAKGAKSAGQLGKEGEAAVRGAYEIGEKAKLTINGRARIPDGLIPEKSLSEVKNVEKLSYTRQLRDYSDYAKSQNLRFDLYTRPTTQLSGPLKQAILNGDINRINIP